MLYRQTSAVGGVAHKLKLKFLLLTYDNSHEDIAIYIDALTEFNI